MANEKEFEVKTVIRGKVVILPIRATNAEIARALADSIAKRKGGKDARVLGATEKKP